MQFNYSPPQGVSQFFQKLKPDPTASFKLSRTKSFTKAGQLEEYEDRSVVRVRSQGRENLAPFLLANVEGIRITLEDHVGTANGKIMVLDARTLAMNSLHPLHPPHLLLLPPLLLHLSHLLLLLSKLSRLSVEQKITLIL